MKSGVERKASDGPWSTEWGSGEVRVGQVEGVEGRVA